MRRPHAILLRLGSLAGAFGSGVQRGSSEDPSRCVSKIHVRVLATHCARALLTVCPRKKGEGAGKAGWPHAPGLSRKRNLRERENHRYRR